MISIDVVCPLYKAEDYIDNLIFGLKSQEGIIFNKVVFAITEWTGMEAVVDKIKIEGYACFFVKPGNFSHSLTRQKAIYNYCESNIVIMMSQDVNLCNKNALYELAKSITDEVVYSFGRQICKKKTIEYYVRKKNYGDENIVVSIEDVERMQLKTFFASDAFAAYNRQVFLSLNGYDSVHMMMNEDMYYAKKILEAGYKKEYVASAVVEHSHKFSLKQLYNRYCQTGKWFAKHPEFDNYKTTDTGLKLAIYVIGQALIEFNIPVIFRWLPDMTARYLGMKRGKKLKD